MGYKQLSYVLIFLLSFVIVSGVVVFQKRSDLFPWIGDCNASGYGDDDHFMAYCHSGKFGDFEHFAYWNELEPVSMQPVKEADVLFLGNSRTQYSFSTDPVSQFFDQNAISHYVFGFGIGSYHVIPQSFFLKYQLKPKVLVINADPFFYDYWSGANKEMLETKVKTRWRFNFKVWMQQLQKDVCGDDHDGWLGRALCRGKNETLYRDRKNGHWIVDYYRPDKRIPVGYTDAYVSHFKQGRAIALNFLKSVGISPECVIVTATPQKSTPVVYAQEIAKAMGAHWVFPVVKDLLTIDESHLNKDSAKRWSGGFMQKAAPIIQKCVSR